MRTGASRLTRSVSPYTYSSATKSPTTTTSAREKAGSRLASAGSSGSRMRRTPSYLPRAVRAGQSWRGDTRPSRCSGLAPPRSPRSLRGSLIRLPLRSPLGARRRPRLPAAVKPVPAVGVDADPALQPVIQVLHEREHVAIAVAGVRGGERALEDHLVPPVAERHRQAEQDRGPAADREHRRRRRGRGGHPEERGEDGVAEGLVLVDHVPEHAPRLHRPDRSGEGRALRDDEVLDARAAPDRAPQVVRARLAHLARDHRDGEALQRVGGREKVEVPEVPGAGDEPLPLGAGRLELLPPVVHEHPLDLLARQERDAEEVGDHLAQVPVGLARDVAPLRLALLGERKAEVLEDDAAPDPEGPDERAERGAEGVEPAAGDADE